MTRVAFLLLLAFALASRGTAVGRTAQTAAQMPAAEKSDEGIPVTSDLVTQKCSSCHKADEKGRLSRISFRRTTPEGWEETIKRMVSLNNLRIEPSDAREILRYLADHHGLAPEEARPAAFEAERRQIDYKYAADKDTEQTCTRCHSMGRVISQRRTKEEWELLIAMHRGYYPLSDFQAFRRGGPPQREPGPDGRPPDNRHPMEKAVSHLSTAFPLATPEWSRWAATMRPPGLQGKWAIDGYQAGEGPVFGQVVITPQGDADKGDFTTESTLIYARSGRTVTRRGRAIVYTGFQWRGRSTDVPSRGATDGVATASAGQAPDRSSGLPGPDSPWREVLFVDPDWRRATGRWFTGAYDEFGIDVRLERIGADPILLGAGHPTIKTGTASESVRLYGANLPTQLNPRDLNFGPGITVERIVSATASQLVASISVDKDATPGRRAVFLTGAAGNATVALHNGIDFIKVSPQAGLARVGGANFPKQFQQFEAVAYANGPDGKPDTKDDIELGAVDVSWSLEEYTATYDDDDKDFVGTIDASKGLFTPNLDGPNPNRKHGTNNYGDVWVVATYQPAGATRDRAIRGRAHLLVTVPLYIKWDQPEVSR
jgi:quinohemoprotein amine dehydrogenase